MKKGLKDERGMSWATLGVIIFIVILGIYFLIKSGFFSAAPEKIENEVAGVVEVEYDEINHNTDEADSAISEDGEEGFDPVELEVSSQELKN